MKNHVKTIVTLAAITLFAWSGTQAEAQKHFKNRYSVGFGFMPEWQLGGVADGKFSPSYGVSFDAQFSPHSGLEFGLYNRQFRYITPYGAPGGGITYPFTEKDVFHYVSLRLGYKFYSNILNFSAGFNVDFAASTPGSYSNYEKNTDRYGLYLTISKDIPLYKGLILEPEVYVNPFLCDQNKTVKTTDYEGTFLGLGVKLKYRF